MSKSWTGKFVSSTCGPLVKGQFLVTLDEDKTEYEAPFKCEYTGPFRHGITIDGNLTVSENTMSTTFGDSQKLSFTMKEKTSKRITGTYCSMNPSDIGTFTMEPGNQMYDWEFADDGTFCNLL